MQKEWYREELNKVLSFFGTTAERGLTEARVLDRREKYGSNTLSDEKVKSFREIFIDQFKSPLIYVLLIAAIIVLVLGDYVEGAIILFIIILNAIIGTLQEGKARSTLAALKKIVKSYTTVVREGEEVRISDSELVPGDIILLKDGEAIGADARIVEANSLQVNESSLTGESKPVLKHAEPIAAAALAAADQRNMVFRGTYIVSGLGRAVVVRTGIHTVIGKISQKLTRIDIDVPLKKNIENLSRLLVIAVLFASVLIFIGGLSQGIDIIELFTTVVAVAVSAIPESLPVVVTLVLASGVWRMSRQNVLVKKLQAVEALGQANVIALDKTGTITKNQMAVERIFTNGKMFEVTGSGYEPKGQLFQGEVLVDQPLKDKNIDLMLKVATFTSIADIVARQSTTSPDSEQKDFILSYGDPTEASLKVLAQKFGYEKERLLRKYPQVAEMPFNAEYKHHSTINAMSNGNMLSVAGSPEMILERAPHIYRNGRSVKMTESSRAEIQNSIQALSRDGYRVLALATTMNPPESTRTDNLPKLTFIGLVGITDAIRPEVVESVRAVRSAGMRVVMITGDYAETARSIARQVEIFRDGDIVLTGREIREMSDEQLVSALEKATVFARVSPEEKLRIIENYKARGETIAMTGDGVNDALSLVAADLGVAMGKIGTEVAREAADIVLLDDKFGNITSAAEEGRNIFFNIRRAILYLLATNLGEMMVIVVAIFVGWPLPLLATQIIWLNLVTDTFLVAALAFEPKERGIMKRSFKRPSKYMIDMMMGIRIVLIGMLMTIVTLWMFNQYVAIDMVKAWTVSLTVLTVFQWYNIFNIRSDSRSVFQMNIFTNRYLIFGLVVAIGLHIFAIYNGFMQRLLDTTALSWVEWGVILFVCLSIILLEEVRKIFYRIYLRKINEPAT